jgi:hypothetical protein
MTERTIILAAARVRHGWAFSVGVRSSSGAASTDWSQPAHRDWRMAAPEDGRIPPNTYRREAALAEELT